MRTDGLQYNTIKMELMWTSSHTLSCSAINVWCLKFWNQMTIDYNRIVAWPGWKLSLRLILPKSGAVDRGTTSSGEGTVLFAFEILPIRSNNAHVRVCTKLEVKILSSCSIH